MKFQDKDICTFTPHANGVVLKLVADNMLDAVDGHNMVGVYIYENELEQLISAIDSPSRGIFEPLHDVEFDLSFNSAVLDQSMFIFDASAIDESPLTKRNRAYVFVGLQYLSKAYNRIVSEKKRIEEGEAWHEALKLMTGCQLAVADDSNKVILKQA